LLDRDFRVTARQANESRHPAVVKVAIQTKRADRADLPVVLRGAHQATNTALAVAALDELQAQGYSIPETAIRHGLLAVDWPARVEVVGTRPTVVIDAAHNWESARALIATLHEEFIARRKILIFAATRDKDVAGLLRLLIPAFDTILFTRYRDNPRSVPAAELQSLVHAISNRPVHVTDSPEHAWQLASEWATADDLIAITGSFFLVAELRDLVKASCERRSNATST
jgi:dihydrofolate synthase/folylpolyglutamate synthase